MKSKRKPALTREWTDQQPRCEAQALESRTLLSGGGGSTNDLYLLSSTLGTVGEYSQAGATVNASLVSGLSFNSGPYGAIAVSGNDLFVVNTFAGTVGEYTTSGATINANLVSGLSGEPFGLAVNGSDLYIVFGYGHIDKYILGATPGTITLTTPNLVTGLGDADSVVVDGTNLFVSEYDSGRIGEYTTSGATINAALVTGLSNPEVLVREGTNLFVSEQGSGQRIGEYTESGATVNANLVPGLDSPYMLGVSNGNLFVGVGTGEMAEYTTAGAAVATPLISGLQSPFGLYVADDATASNQLAYTVTPQLAGTGSGALTTVQVAVENSLGQIISTASGTITLSIASGPPGGTLGGTTSMATSAGTATFTDLSVSTPGTYTLTASDGVETPVTSSSFTFTVAGPAKTIGGLDPSFGTGGLAGHDVGFNSTSGLATDGTASILIGPIGAAGSESFGVTRYLADGSLDTSFGSGGVASTAFGATDAVPAAVQVLANGDILVAGTATTFSDGIATGSQFAVAEYNADGSLNSNFGFGGVTLLNFASALTSDVLHAMAVAADGTIYLAGSTNSSSSGGIDFGIAALSSTGSLKSSFADVGVTLVDIDGGDDQVNSLAIQSNGDVVAAGSAVVNGVTDVAIARLLPDGTLDKKFGNRGAVTSSVGGVFDSASSVVIQPKGQIVIGGLSASGSSSSLSSDFLVQRYTATGKLDRSFGGGTVTTSFGQPSAVTQVALQADGSIIASGKTSTTLGGTLDVAIARYTARGALDTSFNTTGKVVIDLNAGVVATPSLAGALAAAASTLGAEFDAFTSSLQGVVAVTQGGAILSAGNSGSDTVEAELVAAGVDLVTKLLSALPASVLGGATGKVQVTLTESGTTPAKGLVTLTIEFATDAAGSNISSTQNFQQSVNLKPGRSKTYKLTFNYPTGLASGGYFLLANVTNGAGVAADLNDNNNIAAAASATTIAPPFVELAGSSLSSSAIIAGKLVNLTINLVNNGNITAKGKTQIDFYLSSDQTIDNATLLGHAPLTVSLPTGKPRPVRLKLIAPASLTAGTFNLLAVIEPGNLSGADDVLISAASPVTVG